MSASSETFHVNLYLSGPVVEAESILRGYCMDEGFCVTITPTKFIYTGGEEVGYIVGIVNYPRFPDTPENLHQKGLDIARKLLRHTHQNSALVESSFGTTRLTRDDGDV